MSWGTTTTALCLGELQGYRARAVEFFERCCEQRTDPLIKLIQAINVRQNQICKLPDVSPSDTLAFTIVGRLCFRLQQRLSAHRSQRSAR
jgi:hypothetical protein